VQDILFKCSTLQAKIGVQGSGKIVNIEGAGKVEWRGSLTMLTFWNKLNDSF